ncbi:exopolysaccharide biosynthesis protein [Phenylobacterium deserti]|uniref:Exopolysaccharide biosynthesis protein n=1 Tax=Phenylobacterium deserti TaxID=1914756 RepID=A0A328AS45_9CAUL|nr:exopolysaccharide biosynthesis protein [Phenylobacterium deserti]RAK57081.1 exopolysaccharide biosynthesis protein [Phenylobacterium deserti]
MSEPADDKAPLSAVLRDLSLNGGPRVSIGELMERFGGRAMGALLLVFGLACALPLPPGATTVFGLPLLLLAPQLLFGARAPWVPGKLRRRTMSRVDLRTGLNKALPWLERIESISRPRFSFLFGGTGQRIIGLVCTLLAFVLILPIPLGNMLPAASVTVLSLALVQRDGALALIGYALAVASVGVLVLAAGLIMHAAQHLIAIITSA